jgi:hypothetical protein
MSRPEFEPNNVCQKRYCLSKLGQLENMENILEFELNIFNTCNVGTFQYRHLIIATVHIRFIRTLYL